jgi:outer membrane protein OmpA-like peptidoglycan-associated protein
MRSYQYTVTLKADGHLPSNELIETQDPSGVGKIDKNFYLVPTGVGQTLRLKSLIFAQSRNDIPNESYPELDQLVLIMKKNPNMMIQLEGHTDYKGKASLNMQLSQSRVEAVKNYLITKGIKPKKIKLKAFGGSQPLSRDSSDELRSVNRRVEVRILKN